ncbi:unnamed protein product, partial [Gulo gulo]
GLKSEQRNFKSFRSAFTKQTSLSGSREESTLEFSEEDSDIDLTLTISPPTSPREEVPAGGPGEAPMASLELQDATEEITGPEEVTVLENPEVDSANYTSMFSTMPEKSLESKERKGDNLQTVTLILSKETCALEIAEEVNVTSDFPFASLIEEVSPASSPDHQDPVETAHPPRALSLCGLQLASTLGEGNDRFSRIESVNLALTEKEHSFVGPTHPVGQDNLPGVQQMQLCAEMPVVGSKHPEGRDGSLTLPGELTEEIGPGEHGEGFSFSEKLPFCAAELSQPASAARYGEDVRLSLEKLVPSGNPLPPVSVQNRNFSSLVLETSEPPCSPTKMTENKSLADTFVSTTAPSGTVNVSLKQQTSPQSTGNHLFSGGVKTDEGLYLQARSLSSCSAGGADTQTCGRSESPRLAFPSDGAALPHCPRPTDTEIGVQTQEIPVVKMASLLKNSDAGARFHEEATDLGGVDSQSSATSPEDKPDTVHVLQDRAVCETKDLLNAGLFPMCAPADSHHKTAITGEDTSREPCASVVPPTRAPPVCGVSEEQTASQGSAEGLRAKEDSGTVGRDVDVSVNSEIQYEPLSGESDQDSCGGCRNPQSEVESSCPLRCSQTKKEEDTSKVDDDSFLSLNNSDNEEWGYSPPAPGLETGAAPRHWLVGFKKEDRYVPSYIQIRDLHGIPRTYANFTITKELTDTTRTLHSLRRHPNFTAKCGLLSSWTNTWQVADDLTQNTLDLEYLRFAHKLKQTVKKGDAQPSASSTSVFAKEPPLQIGAGAFPPTRVPESPALQLASRSRSPLVVTVVHSGARQQSPRGRGHAAGSWDGSSLWQESGGPGRNPRADSESGQTASFHLNRLRYNTSFKESRNDISLILSEYAEFNKVVATSKPAGFPGRECGGAPGEAAGEPRAAVPRAASYEDLVTDLCASLHVRLMSVVKEACRSPCLFYLVETEDPSFSVRTKSILRKGGHTEIEPQHFCQAVHRENDTLLVVIRNEDTASRLHQIPFLLKLKHFPSVLFAGVDGPEDVLEHTYQELLQTGGFVVSDDEILETVTLAQLKDVAGTLEKLNGNGRWKWLLHHRENKKLREDIRVNSVARRKNLILKSCQSANLIEPLPYHQCDSRAPTKAEHLKCLLNLQIQHVHARFAVFLTEKPTVSREVFENSGILVTDVNNFIENIPKIAAPFKSSYWGGIAVGLA